jgi:natural product biosynthesis luciferase-like monooxygenase protein
MDDQSKRIASLTPQQRDLLVLRLKQKGMLPPLQSDHSSPNGVGITRSAAEGDVAKRIERDGGSQHWKRRSVSKGIEFSLYFFSADGSKQTADKYRLLLESAKFADANGFSAVWTPERHFQDFGGLYPNPSVLGAALAMITERLKIRAGSVALPLHNPIRVVEEWAVVDNLSKGRVGISFASGWHSDDFVFFPDNYDERKAVMFRYIQDIQKLWAGETVKFQGVGGREVELRTLPKPVQPTLPIWITSAGNPETWERAAEIGANVLGTLAGYSFEDLAQQIALYRASLTKHGHDGQAGQVTLMLHTFVGNDNDAVKEIVKAPLRNYLRGYIKQFKNTNADVESLTENDLDALTTRAFEHYFEASTLLGTPDKCGELIERLIQIGANEVACLIDFGVDVDAVLGSLHYLNQLREYYRPGAVRQTQYDLTKEHQARQ